MKLKSTIATILVVMLAFVSGALFTGAWGTVSAYADQPPTATPCDDGEGSTGDCHGNPDGNPPGDPDPNPQGCLHGEPDCTPTPEPTNIPTDVPTDTPTEEPTATPDPGCEFDCEPTLTDLPPDQTPTSESPGGDDDKPDRLPNTGLAELPSTGDPLEWDGRMWQEPSSKNTWYAHSGVGGVAQEWLYLNPGDTYEFYGMEYVVTGVFRVAPESVWVIDGAMDMSPYGLTLITCTGYVNSEGIWRYRLVIYAVPTE